MGQIYDIRKRKKGKHLNYQDRQLIEYLVKKAYPKKVSVRKLVAKMERKMGRVKFAEMFKTITVDNGSEFLNHKKMEGSLRSKKRKRTEIYYCHPYSSWERGTNEQTNGMVRRFIPKGTLISPIPKGDIIEIESWINNYPRRLFKGKSSNQKELDFKKAQ